MLVKEAELSTNLFAVVDVVVPFAASPPPSLKTGEFVSASQEPINLNPPANPFTCDCSFPNPSTIVSVAKTELAEGEVNPVNTLLVTELLSNVTEPLTLLVPSTLDIVPVA